MKRCTEELGPHICREIDDAGREYRRELQFPLLSTAPINAVLRGFLQTLRDCFHRRISEGIRQEVAKLNQNLESMQSRVDSVVPSPARFELNQQIRYERGLVVMLGARLAEFDALILSMDSVHEKYADRYRSQDKDVLKELLTEAWAKRKGLNIDPELLRATSGAFFGNDGTTSNDVIVSSAEGEEGDDTDEDWTENWELLNAAEGEED